MRELRKYPACAVFFILSFAFQPAAAQQGWQAQTLLRQTRLNEQSTDGAWASRAGDKFNLQTGPSLLMASPPVGCITKTLTFDELPTQPVNGLRFMGGALGYQLNGVDSNEARYNRIGPGPGSTTFTNGPVLEAFAPGVLTLTFDAPTPFLQFAVAFFSTSNLIPGFTVELFDSALQSIGIVAINASPIAFFSEGLFSFSGPLVKRAVISFNPAGFLAALDNLSYRQQTFDQCLQDDSTGNILLFDSITGEYLFSNCSGITLNGQGVLTRKGSMFTLQHNGADRRVLARVDTSVNKGTASIQLLSQGTTFTITDRNTRDNTCACP